MKIRVRMKNKQGVRYINNLAKKVNKSLTDLYNSDKLQNVVIANTWEKVPMDEEFLRASAVKYKQLYRGSKSSGRISTQVRYRALNVRKDMKNTKGYSSVSASDLIGGAFNYACIQEVHEFAHYTTPGTGSRYLRKGLEESQPQIKRMTLEAIMKGMAKK